MKRLGCFIVAVCLLFLVGCGNGRKDDLPPEPIAFGFTEADFGEIIFNDYRVTDDILTVDLSGNNRLREILESLCYNEAEGDITPEGVEKYSLYFGARAFRFYEDGTVLYSDGINGEVSVLLYGEGLSYLDGVTAGAAASVGEYSEDAEITVHDGNNLKAEITENGEFLISLNEVKVIRLSNAEDYTLSELDYTVKIGGDTIKIYGDFITINGELYAIFEGDFDFLSDYTYKSDSSGFLPWV